MHAISKNPPFLFIFYYGTDLRMESLFCKQSLHTFSPDANVNFPFDVDVEVDVFVF